MREDEGGPGLEGPVLILMLPQKLYDSIALQSLLSLGRHVTSFLTGCVLELSSTWLPIPTYTIPGCNHLPKIQSHFIYNNGEKQ